eukprot:6909443-Lingulodinium_polyedra.AAC.1
MVHLLLCLRVQAEPGRLQGARHQEAMRRVKSPASRSQVLGGVVGLCRRGESVRAAEGFCKRLHHQGKCS